MFLFQVGIFRAVRAKRERGKPLLEVPFSIMGTQATLNWLEPALGAALIGLVLLDVFWTVLYARISTGILSYRIARVTWVVFLRVSKHPDGAGHGDPDQEWSG